MPRSKKKKDDSSPGAPLWLVTYGDMVTLVLTFFVLLFSMSSIDARKFEMMVHSFKGLGCHARASLCRRPGRLRRAACATRWRVS